ncbi:hypothetical protein FRB95_014455 [Tulasnella sp. JGI-2019a]|nr:hypothetical protein FRB95_014455 [Tulasnella sp. JGI-2019a]
MGDSSIVNPGIFAYKVLSIAGGGGVSGASSTVDYKGQTLENCDVVYMSSKADVRLLEATIDAYLVCTNETQFPVVFTTSFYSTGPRSLSSDVSSAAFAAIDQVTPKDSIAQEVTNL